MITWSLDKTFGVVKFANYKGELLKEVILEEIIEEYAERELDDEEE